ncbi:MAG: ribosomal protein L7Ae/L30e/S12e/Gadd45 family protein [Gemmatimonadetes bacterium]|nr:ribosomal protein L7Ae/L30e/S12e/Gadd45 family protein [Gemmatimonadota bacterium]
MNDVTRRKLAGLVGLGARARTVVTGVEMTKDAAKKGKLVFALVAPDASKNSRDKIVPMLTAKRIRFSEALDMATLGVAVGRDQTAAVGIVDRNLAKGIRALLDTGSDEPTGRMV